MRAALSLALLAGVSAQSTCRFNRTGEVCPGEGAPCSNKVLCQSGLYCKVEQLGQSGSSFTGRCARGPKVDDIYNKPCDLGTDYKSCQFQDALALSPYQPPTYLQCVKSPFTDRAGTCLLGPQKHGDGCNQEGECASGNCLKELRICRGVDEGEECAPGYPDPCMPNHYCAPDPATRKGGKCQKSVSMGRACNYPTACERGTYCAGDSSANRKCVPMFSVDVGKNTTIGPYMCTTGTAVMVKQGEDSTSSLYQCVSANASFVGNECNPARPAPVGYECKCSADGKMRLRTIGALGLGLRTKAFSNLYKCLLTAQNPMGDACEFDSVDMERVRYGSCAFYACYPYYLALVNATGGRTFSPPLDQFEPRAQCEVNAAKTFYKNVADTPCIAIPNLENWKCASLAPPTSLSVQDTAGVIAFIFIIVWGAYWYHMYRFRKENGQKVPCVKA